MFTHRNRTKFATIRHGCAPILEIPGGGVVGCQQILEIRGGEVVSLGVHLCTSALKGPGCLICFFVCLFICSFILHHRKYTHLELGKSFVTAPAWQNAKLVSIEVCIPLGILIVLESYQNNSLTKICIKIQAYKVYIPKCIFFSENLATLQKS